MQGNNTGEPFVNDIGGCLERAMELSRALTNISTKDHRICRIFQALANDDLIGAIAFGIWRERSRLLLSKMQSV